MEWKEIDFEKKEWLIPAHKMKMNREHLVPLSNWALDILKELKKTSKSSKYVFVSNNKNQPISDNTLALAMKRLGYKGIAVPHGFRVMASSILNESGKFSPDAIERQLSHCDRNKVRGVYNRAEYWQERCKMMQWYADFLKKQSKIKN